MIIISNKPGQLGNLLFIYAHFLAFGIETNVAVLNPSFYSYRAYFSITSQPSITGNKLFYTCCYFFARILVKLKVKNRFLNVMALDWGETADLEDAAALRSTLCFVQGWLFRSDKLFKKHSKEIKDFFEPAEIYKNKLTAFFNHHFPGKNECIVGIHIRRGDYKTFEDGKYYYTVDEYINVIKQVAVLFKSNNPHFLICSNETIDLGEAGKNLKITYAPGHELLDMYCLANCSYIVGPPSTYSMWASFYGTVPLYMIKDLATKISINDFKQA